MTTPSIDKQLDHGQAMADAARKKALKAKPDLPDVWEAYDFRHVTGGIMAIGSDTKAITRGPNKGFMKPIKSNRMEIVLTREDIDAELDKQREALQNGETPEED